MSLFPEPTRDQWWELCQRDHPDWSREKFDAVFDELELTKDARSEAARAFFEFDRDGWWLVCREVRPEWTREQFDAEWDEFQRLKAARAADREA